MLHELYILIHEHEQNVFINSTCKFPKNIALFSMTECEISTHPDTQSLVRLITHLHLYGEDVSRVIRLHLLHERSFLSQQRVI